MTIHLLFFTVTFKVSKTTEEQETHYQNIKKINQENEMKLSQYRSYL